MKNVHLLPTNKPSRLSEFGGQFTLTTESTDAFRNYNIYITSSEEIKKGDWYFFNYQIIKCENPDLTKIPIVTKNYCKKIILTTDRDLINDGVQAIDDEFLEWFVENPSCEEVEVKELLSNNGNAFYGYKIIIPDLWGEILDWLEQEEPKRETLEEAAKRIFPNKDSFGATARNGFVQGAKYMAERMYSESDMNEFALYVLLHDIITPKKWFNQFKKK
jgi:hypothetical protein